MRNCDRRVKMLVLTEEGLDLRTRALARCPEAPPGSAASSAAEQGALRDLLRKAVEAS